MDKKPRHVFLCGIGGSGMSSLALVLLSQGCKVTGSDRAFDDGDTPEKFAQLVKCGIVLKPQDGSGVDAQIDAVIVSSAIEKAIPDIAKADKLGIEVFKRADVLAEYFNRRDGIAIGGTSGKSSVTAMLGHILKKNGLDPTVINGAAMVNAIEGGSEGLGNAMIGKTDSFVIEADESDGTIALYKPKISVLTNVTLDHKPIAETLPLFKAFLERGAQGAVVNLDNEGAASLATVNPNTLSFSLKNRDAGIFADNLSFTAEGVSFSLREKSGDSADVTLLVPGKHNVENALAAIAAARLAGVRLDDCAKALADFKGIKRRLEILGREDGVTVIDDFGHNPDKIAASLSALKQAEGRLIVLFQPHGFAPVRMLGEGMTESFADGMGKDDILVLPEILYLGGTVKRDVSSALIADGVNAEKNAPKAVYIPYRKGAVDKSSPDYMPTKDDVRQNKEDALEWILKEAKSGDRIVIMGARDDTLTELGLGALKKLKARSKTPVPKAPEI